MTTDWQKSQNEKDWERHYSAPLGYPADALRAAYPDMSREWRSMGSAPTDGTIVNVVGRYLDATAGFPMYAAFHNGDWWTCARNSDLIIVWAWRPRDEWPHSAENVQNVQNEESK